MLEVGAAPPLLVGAAWTVTSNLAAVDLVDKLLSATGYHPDHRVAKTEKRAALHLVSGRRITNRFLADLKALAERAEGVRPCDVAAIAGLPQACSHSVRTTPNGAPPTWSGPSQALRAAGRRRRREPGGPWTTDVLTGWMPRGPGRWITLVTTPSGHTLPPFGTRVLGDSSEYPSPIRFAFARCPVDLVLNNLCGAGSTPTPRAPSIPHVDQFLDQPEAHRKSEALTARRSEVPTVNALPVIIWAHADASLFGSDSMNAPSATDAQTSDSDVVLPLVERFNEHEAEYRRSYGEAQVRQDFIDPLFEALGWDVKNTKSRAEAYREVVVEDALRIDGAVKAPDYAFRIGGQTKFYVEAKKPQIDLGHDKQPAYQLRRYGWNAKLALSVLTNFETFAVYECITKPKLTDKPSASRVMYFPYTDLPGRWAELSMIFSPEGIQRGCFDKYAGSPSRKRGTAPVDTELLAAIREWRELLARNVALRNPELSIDDLNYVVQAILDRIVFLRICEDRRIEPEGQLRDIIRERGAYPALARLFVHADAKYNSGLFHFRKESARSGRPDLLSLGINIDDSVIHNILRSLYFPDSPFEFSVIPPAILGQIYEQFLGETIRLTPSHRAVIEVKPEIRKVGGVFYTPSDIVRYIVDRTVLPALEGVKISSFVSNASRKRVPLAVLDPACGSGTFLLEAYEALLTWHLSQYLGDPHTWTKGRTPKLVEIGSGNWRLSSDERKRILTDHIFGVDIDSHAVEVTKLSLLLKVLEGETDETINAQLKLFHARALPDLDANIRCGNSLIETDLYELDDIVDLDDETFNRLNPFDWNSEFAAVMAGGGFSAVIGNPPYVLMQNAGLPAQELYLSEHYRSAQYKIDTYHVFMERAIELLRDGGRLGFITPSSFLLNQHAMQLRELLLSKAQCEAIRVNLYQVFAGASVDTTVSIWRKGKPRRNETTRVSLAESPGSEQAIPAVKQSDWQSTRRSSFLVFLSGDMRDLVRAMETRSVPLGDFATAYFGIQTWGRDEFVSDNHRADSWKPALDGANINRYSLSPPIEYVCTSDGAIKSGGDLDVYEHERIGVRQIGRSPIATLLPGGWYSLNTIYNVYFTKQTDYDLRFILALFNSKALAEYWRVVNSDLKPTFPKIKKDALLKIPVPRIEFDSPAKRAVHDRLCKLVDQLLHANEMAREARQPSRRERHDRLAKSLDRRIEGLVGEAYGL